MSIQPIVQSANKAFTGIQRVPMSVTGVSASATETMAALLVVVIQHITTFTTNIKKDTTAFSVSTSVLLVKTKHIVLYVKIIIGVDNAVTNVITAMVPVT